MKPLYLLEAWVEERDKYSNELYVRTYFLKTATSKKKAFKRIKKFFNRDETEDNEVTSEGVNLYVLAPNRIPEYVDSFGSLDDVMVYEYRNQG